MKYLIVVDMQNDFINGGLGTAEAKAIMPALIEKVKNFDGRIIATKDTHGKDYPMTQEGKNLPVPHCIEGTEGWEFPHELSVLLEYAEIYEKSAFGCLRLANDLVSAGDAESVELIGLCTDICVIANALIIKAALPEVPVCVDAECCAGTTPEKHNAALEVMESCQILIRR